MSSKQKDFWGAIALALISVVTFILLMGTILVWGQRAGANLRGAMTPSSTDGAAQDTTAAPGADDHAAIHTPAATAVASAGDFLGADVGVAGMARAMMAESPDPVTHVPVLCYHYIRGSSGPLRIARVLAYVVMSLPVLDETELWTQGRSTFERHMRYLVDNGYNAVTLDEVAAWQNGEVRLPPNPVAITFDDGDRSVYDYAFPILRELGLRATFFVVTGHVGQEWENLNLLSWSELREMQDSGVFDIESHTNDMHFKVGMRDAALPVFIAAERGRHEFEAIDDWRDAVVDDLRRSRELIELYVDHEPRFLAWPYGRGSEELDRLALDAGFDRICTMTHASNLPVQFDESNRPVEIRRYPITARTSMRDLQAMLAGPEVTVAHN